MKKINEKKRERERWEGGGMSDHASSQR